MSLLHESLAMYGQFAGISHCPCQEHHMVTSVQGLKRAKQLTSTKTARHSISADPDCSTWATRSQTIIEYFTANEQQCPEQMYLTRLHKTC